MKMQVPLFVAVITAALLASAAEPHASAKRELQTHLRLVADEVPYRFVFEKPADAPAAKPFESRYRVAGDTVWFWGDDSDSERNGTLFAVELFAERELGIRWLWPGDDGTTYRHVKTLKLPAKSEGSFESKLLLCRLRNYKVYKNVPWEEVSHYTDMPKELYEPEDESIRPSTFETRQKWRQRNRLQSRAIFGYGHAFQDWPDRFRETHPEYLNWNAAAKKRCFTGDEPQKYAKLCASCEGVSDQIVADWKAHGAGRFVNICENDGPHWCECDVCRALDVVRPGEKPHSHLTDRYVHLWNRIAAKARAVRPDVLLITYAYSAYHLPPRREKVAYPDNMLFGFVCGEKEDCIGQVKAWKAAGMKNFFLRPNYFHSLTAIHRGYDKFFYDQYHQLIELGMIGCDHDANDNRPTTAIEFYVVLRMLIDPSATYEDIVADYYAAYGAAAGEVRAYYDEVRKTGDAVRAKALRSREPGGEYFEEAQELRKKIPYNDEFGRDENELKAKLKMLRKAVSKHEKARDLSAAEMKRLRQLCLQAEHGLKTFLFFTATVQAPLDVLRRRAKELNAFRIANRHELPDVYSHLYRLWWAEIRYWKLYKARCDEGK